MGNGTYEPTCIRIYNMVYSYVGMHMHNTKHKEEARVDSKFYTYVHACGTETR